MSKTTDYDSHPSTIVCACGCGMEAPRFNNQGRPRKFIRGHNRYRAEQLNDKILAILDFRPMKTQEFTDLTDLSKAQVRGMLARLKRKGVLTHVERGLYGRGK